MSKKTNATEIMITLVNDEDEIIGHGEKMAVHEQGLLHRAFSILIYDAKGQMLLHQRALEKYHSPGLWTNACCGHPNEGEKIEDAAHRRLKEEMDFDCELTFGFKFRYFASFENGLKEHEIDHVFTGEFNNAFVPNPEEVADFKWVDTEAIKSDIASQPDLYTVWFKGIMERF